jgi:hypothetical protein
MPSAHERTLAAEWIVVVLVQTGDALAGGPQGPLGGPKLPNPARYFAAMIAYLMLAGLALFGDKAGKLAASLGGVAALAILIAPSTPGGKPLIMRFLSYLNSMLVAGPISAPNQSQVGPARSGSSYSGDTAPVYPGNPDQFPPGTVARPGQVPGYTGQPPGFDPNNPLGLPPGQRPPIRPT